MPTRGEPLLAHLVTLATLLHGAVPDTILPGSASAILTPAWSSRALLHDSLGLNAWPLAASTFILVTPLLWALSATLYNLVELPGIGMVRVLDDDL
jgi:hypothetical protein